MNICGSTWVLDKSYELIHTENTENHIISVGKSDEHPIKSQ